MHGAGALQRLGYVAKLALAVLADCLCRLDVTEGHGDLCDRPRFERLAAVQFALYRPAAFARRLFHRHLATSLPPFSPPLFVIAFSCRNNAISLTSCGAPKAGCPVPAGTWPPCGARY